MAVPLVRLVYGWNMKTWATLLVALAYASVGEMHTAARSGDVERVKALLASGVSANVRDSLGGTPLHDAAWAGDTAVVEVLLAAGAEIDARHLESESTPLQYAVTTHHMAVAELLLDKGANVNAVTKAGATALHLAANRGYKDLLALLIKRGA